MDIKSPFFTLAGTKTIGRLVDVYDGDTVTCIFPIFGDNYFKFNLRLIGIDTDELKNLDAVAKSKAQEARHKILITCCENYNLNQDCHRDEIQKYLNDNETYVWIECFQFDKYGRILANVYQKDKDKNKDISLSLSLSDVLLNANLAYKYDGGKKQASKN
jgi:endonuclease YncB( thermonuclease family)